MRTTFIEAKTGRFAVGALSALLLVAFALPVQAESGNKRARKKTPSISVSFERLGGFGLSKIEPDEGDGGSLTSFTIGGFVTNPVMMPRGGLDLIVGPGLTIGGAMGFTWLSGEFEGDDAPSASGYMYLLEPRLGYRAAVSPNVDLIPRLGYVFTGGHVEIEYASECESEGAFGDCDPDKLELDGSATAAVAELVVVWRITPSLNFIVGFSADIVMGAEGEEPDDDETAEYEGSLNTFSAWGGIGGYIP